MTNETAIQRSILGMHYSFGDTPERWPVVTWFMNLGAITLAIEGMKTLLVQYADEAAQPAADAKWSDLARLAQQLLWTL